MSTKNEMLACVEREIKMRERVYPARVARGRMSRAKAAAEIATMRAILAALVQHVPGDPVVQADLFSGGVKP